MKLENRFLRIFLRMVVLGILSLLLTFFGWRTFENSATPTIGAAAVPILSSDPRSFGKALEIAMVVDLLVTFGFLFGIWFLWAQGRNHGREKGRSTLRASRLRIGGILIVAALCALPLAYYVVQVKSSFHSGLAETPAEVMESFVLSEAACAIALCGIAIVARFWSRANAHSPATRS